LVTQQEIKDLLLYLMSIVSIIVIKEKKKDITQLNNTINF